jgi:hypothetical protein
MLAYGSQLIINSVQVAGSIPQSTQSSNICFLAYIQSWTPFITFTITSKVAVYAPAEWADTLTLFHLYQYMYSVVHTPLAPAACVWFNAWR